MQDIRNQDSRRIGNLELRMASASKPALPYLPKLLITIFGHTHYVSQGDTMFLGHPNNSGDFP